MISVPFWSAARSPFCQFAELLGNPVRARKDCSGVADGGPPESFDVWNVLFNLVACRNPTTGAGRFNIGGYCDSNLDALIGQIRAEPMGASRDALIMQALKKVYDESIYVPLHQQRLIWGALNGYSFVQRKNGRILFNEIAKK